MKLTLIYCEVPHGGHIFASPEPIGSETVEVDTWKDLNKYITSKKDAYGQNYKLNPNRNTKHVTGEYRYLTGNGGVQVQKYKAPEIIKIKKIKI